MDILSVINDLFEERGLDKSLLGTIVSDALLAAYKKKYPLANLTADYDKKNGQLSIMAVKTVKEKPTDDLLEISLKKALALNKKAKIDDELVVNFDMPIGRIEVMSAKQIISERIKKIESSQVYNKYKPLEGSIIHGTVNKLQSNGILIRINEDFGFLPKSLMIPGEKFTVGSPIRVLLKEVLVEPRNENQLILDRSTTDFLKCLFRLDIPEVFEGLVDIVKIVRIAGYKSKVIVESSDSNIDPVGTCIGIGGVRIKPILKELSGEKVDIIANTDSLLGLIADSLKPAKIERVELEDGKAMVWLDEDQRSVAIGKLGQNIALASRLTGVDIKLAEKVNLEGLDLV